MKIKFFDRKTKQYTMEQVAGEKYLNWIYSSPLGMSLLDIFIKKKLFSKLYGVYCDHSLSKSKISNFINNFNIDVSTFQDNDFSCFNDFFARKLTSSCRPIDTKKNSLISPCDGKILAYENIDINKIVQVKGIHYTLDELINSKDKDNISKYNGGTCIIFRLCPTDYHRFHFIDNGICSESKKIKGDYYSVNPIALKKINKLFVQNKREISIFKSDNFGDVLWIEVGATCVGSILQTYKAATRVKKGDEKGYFKFGGSTIILFFQKDSIAVDNDILNQTSLGYECCVHFGEKIGIKL